MHKKIIIESGKKLDQASGILVMLHGRGGRADEIIRLAEKLHVNDFALLAPQATSRSWYPYSFLMPPAQNEPWLSGALSLLEEMMEELAAGGHAQEKIFLLGFSQGACLALEFAARKATKYGGVIAFTGGLMGDRIYAENYTGDFAGTQIFIGSSDPDRHVPVERVNQSAGILQGMNARVIKKIYNNMGHTIGKDEIETVNGLFFGNK